MLVKKYLNPFILYNFLLILLFAISVTSIESVVLINSISFVIFHLVIIYLSLYYYRIRLYLIFFIFGLGFDLMLINQIGPHLLAFILLLILMSRIINILKKMNYTKMYLLIIFIQILIIFTEMILASFLFNYKFNLIYYFNLILISVISSYPVLLLLNKIDYIKK